MIIARVQGLEALSKCQRRRSKVADGTRKIKPVFEFSVFFSRPQTDSIVTSNHLKSLSVNVHRLPTSRLFSMCRGRVVHKRYVTNAGTTSVAPCGISFFSAAVGLISSTLDACPDSVCETDESINQNTKTKTIPEIYVAFPYGYKSCAAMLLTVTIVHML